MHLTELLRQNAALLVDEAVAAVRQSGLESYEKAGTAVTRDRLGTLLDLVVRCVERRRTAEIREYADRLARQRFAAGYDLQEVQTAINVLEETVWKHILRDLEPAEYSQALGLVSTVLGAAKDTLAQRYVSLASRREAPALDLRALFGGTDGE